MHENEIAKAIVDAAYKTHVTLGPGLLESVYEMVLFKELTKKGLNCVQQVYVDVFYEGDVIRQAFRADMIVENKVIIEIKSVEEIAPIHIKQLRTYLILSKLKLGLLINFNVDLIKDGIIRVVNRLEE